MKKVWWPIAFASWIMRCSGLTLEVFLHYNFGVRNVSPLMIFVSSIFLGFYVKYSVILFYLFDTSNSIDTFHIIRYGYYDEYKFLYIVSSLSIVLAIIHYLFGLNKYRKGILFHSRYSGTPWLCLLGCRFDFTIKILEPFLLISIGSVLFYYEVCVGFSVWFICGGASLFIQWKIAEYHYFNRILDAIDNQIESKQFNNAVVEKQNPSKTQGFYIPVSNNFRPEERKTLAEMFDAVGKNNAA